jgi:hypothetical protein
MDAPGKTTEAAEAPSILVRVGAIPAGHRDVERRLGHGVESARP